MTDFIAIDFETATEAPQSAISVGLVRYRNYRPIASYYSLIRPPRLYIRRDFTEIHGLTVGDVRDAPDFGHVWKNDMAKFVGTTMLAAHRASFDMNVLKAALEWHGLSVPRLNYFCTHSLARQTWQGLESYSLTALAERFGIVYEAHNALDDAMTCGKLVGMSAGEFGGSGDIGELLESTMVRVQSLSA